MSRKIAHAPFDAARTQGDAARSAVRRLLLAPDPFDDAVRESGVGGRLGAKVPQAVERGQKTAVDALADLTAGEMATDTPAAKSAKLTLGVRDSAVDQGGAAMPKLAVLLVADIETHGDRGRAANALTAVQEFAEAGDETTLIFDGAGTRWAAELAREENALHPLFERVRYRVAGACHYCAGAFDVREQLERDGIPLLRDHKGHPSIHRLVADGFEVVTF